MAIPQEFGLKTILTQLSIDWLLPHADISAGKYSTQQLHELWNPDLPGSQERRIPTNLGNVNVTYGGNEKGPALILWPSLMMRGSMWSYQYEYFKSTHFVVLIDSPGINKSDALRKYFDLVDCAKVVIDIMDAFKIEKCIFGGNSWGANLAAIFPAYYPDRLIGTMVINGTASLPTTPETIMMTIRVETLLMNATIPDWWVTTARAAFSGKSAESNVEFAAYTGCVSQEDPKSIGWALRSVLINRVDQHAVCRSIKKVPVLVVAGEEDRQFPVPMVKSLADAIPTSKFVIAEKTAHLASRENPTLINKIISEWLKEIGADK